MRSHRRYSGGIYGLFLLIWLSSLFILSTMINQSANTPRFVAQRNRKDADGGSKCISVRKMLFGNIGTNRRNVTNVLLVTQMRSGSTFTADLLAKSPSIFYTDEPVREYFGVHASSSDQVEKAIQLLRDILQCNFVIRPHYHALRLSGMHAQNHDTTTLCYISKHLCWDPSTNEALCHSSRVRLARVVNLDLGDVIPLLEDPELNVKVIHLVRDPRGLVASREHLKTLQYVPEEVSDLTLICARYNRDLQAAVTISRDYPHRYTLLRYEDLSVRIDHKIRQIHQFLALPYTPFVARQVAEHTLGLRQENSDPYSLRRNSSTTPFRWRHRISYEYVEAVQKECLSPMRAYGYRIFLSEEEFQEEEVNILVPPQAEFRHLDTFVDVDDKHVIDDALS